MQRIATRGAAAAEAFAHGGRHFLAVATAADPEHGVLVLEWQRGRGMYVEFTKLAVKVVAELGSCLLPSGHVLLGLATWHAGGSFTGESHLYDFDPARTPPLELRQSLPTHGAHDLECFALAEGERGQGGLRLANLNPNPSLNPNPNPNPKPNPKPNPDQARAGCASRWPTRAATPRAPTTSCSTGAMRRALTRARARARARALTRTEPEPEPEPGTTSLPSSSWRSSGYLASARTTSS